eukprot:1262089-Rhodomonas_salina.2
MSFDSRCSYYLTPKPAHGSYIIASAIQFLQTVANPDTVTVTLDQFHPFFLSLSLPANIALLRWCWGEFSFCAKIGTVAVAIAGAT